MDEDYDYGGEEGEYGEYSEEGEFGKEEEGEERELLLASIAAKRIKEAEFPEDYEYADEGENIEMSEINAYERVGTSTLSSYTLKGARNPKEKYRILLTAAIDKVGRHLSQEDKASILSSVGSRDDIIYRNPYTYILGYIGSRGGKGITGESMKKAFSEMDVVPGIEQPDIVRYSIFWMKTTKK